MPLKNQPLSVAQLARNRANAQKSSGPQTLAGKFRAAVNALRHGLYSESVRSAMRALGEDPEEFARLYSDLLEEWRPKAATARRLVRHLAGLMWKLDRVARAELGVIMRRLEALQAERSLNAQSVGQYRYEGPEAEVVSVGLAGAKDSPGKFEEILLALHMLKSLAREGDFSPSFEERVKRVYGPQPTSRGRLIAALLRGLAQKQKESEPLDQTVLEELEKLIDQEMREVLQRYTLFKREHVELPDSLRDAQLAPNEPFFALIIRRENSLARQIERTIKLLMTLGRKKSGNKPRTGAFL